jgi:hypothetical protein
MFAWILKTKPEKARLVRRQRPDRGGARARRRRQIHEVIQQGFEPTVGHGAAEEHRRDLAGEKALAVKGRARGLKQGHFLAQTIHLALPESLQQLSVVPGRLAHLAPIAAAGP